VLAQATANLEKMQAERFGRYEKWRRSSWAGVGLMVGLRAKDK
jgi:hypothetical protein